MTSGGIPYPTKREPVVTIVTRVLTRYRIPFFEALRSTLARSGVALRLVYGLPDIEEALKEDTAALAWGQPIKNRVIRIGGRNLYWQPCASQIQASDLVIVEQANKLLLNYLLLARQAFGGTKVAFWGHGRGLGTGAANRLAESVKRLVSRRSHWWFAYTDGSAEGVRKLGYPPSRITVVQNAIDTAAIRCGHSSLRKAESERVRRRVGIEGRNVAIFAGGLYREKGIGFLIDAARAVRRIVADFELIVIGSGPEKGLVDDAARQHGWIHYVGPCFGTEKIPYFDASRLMLLPGVVGLAVLDSFSLEVPMVTIDLPGHGPEVEYLRDDENGVRLPTGTDPNQYAAAVAELLSDERRCERLRAGCRAAAGVYTLEAMVDRFAKGVLLALRPERSADC